MKLFSFVHDKDTVDVPKTGWGCVMCNNIGLVVAADWSEPAMFPPEIELKSFLMMLPYCEQSGLTSVV